MNSNFFTPQYGDIVELVGSDGTWKQQYVVMYATQHHIGSASKAFLVDVMPVGEEKVYRMNFPGVRQRWRLLHRASDV